MNHTDILHQVGMGVYGHGSMFFSFNLLYGTFNKRIRRET